MANETIVPETRIDAGRLRQLVIQIFERCGMGSEDAAVVSDSLVSADLGGVNSHGVLRIPEYVGRLRRGEVNPVGHPSIVRDSGTCIVVDGGNSMGQIGATFAMDLAIERAEGSGLAAVAVRGSNHCGAMAYYASRALTRNMLGWATTNALPTLAPWGGAERILGINPLAIAIPAGDELPIVYDAAFSGSSHGKIRIYRQQGKTLPVGWALNRDGEPTIDPSEAIEGLLMPIGGFKGTGLAMIMGILSSMLSGASYGTELGDMTAGPRPGQDGHFFLALRVEAFEDIDRFKSRVDRAIRQVHACRAARGVDHIFVAGEREKRSRSDNSAHGIPLNSVVLADLRQIVGELDLSVQNFERLAVGSA